MTTTPLVSIIIPCYNTQDFIAESIESVLAQTYMNWEMIIVDDASTDNSLDIIHRYATANPKIKVISSTHNQGVAESRNIAIREAKGIYIAFLDSDDIWLPTKLSKQISFMLKHMIHMCYSAYNTIDNQGNDIGYYPVEGKVNYKNMLKTSSIGTSTLIYDIKKMGKYYFKSHGHEDYIMKLEMLKNIDYAYAIKESLVKYRIVESSLSRNKFKVALWQWKIYRNIEKLSLFQSLKYFLLYTYYGFNKYKNI